jgi:acetolactate synthase-1/2/3 large subunit
MVHAGSGVIHALAYDELRAVAEFLQAPVTTSWAARGALDERSPLAIPMIHVKLNHLVRNESDAVLVLGSRLGETDWWGKPPYWAAPGVQKMVQVDIDGRVVGANRPADVAVVADIRRFLVRLLAALEARRTELNLTGRDRRLARYREKLARYRTRLDRALADTSSPMNPAQAVAAAMRAFPEGSILVADGGNSAVWTMFYHQATVPGRMLSTFKMGMLGAGPGQAIGAAVARPGEPVCCIIGDGAMGFHPQEVETAVRHRLPIVWLVLADRQWGMVKMNQSFALRPLKMLVRKRLDPGENIWSDLGEIRFDDLARSMGAHGDRIADPARLPDALARALAAEGPAVLHIDVNPVAHMWAPGLVHFKEMHLEPKGR